MESIGDKIRAMRKEKGISLAELAQQSRVSKAYLSQLENGESARPSAEVLYNIAVALGTSIGVLMGKRIVKREEENSAIPTALEQAQIEFGIEDIYIPRLAASSMRDGKKKGEYTKEDWRHLYETLKYLDNQKR